LSYLQKGALTGGEVNLVKDTSRLKAFPLLSHAAIYWPEHARSLTISEDIFDLSYPFYNTKSSVRQAWLKTYWAAKEDVRLPDSFSLLHFASYFGIIPLIENLLLKTERMSKRFRTFVNGKDSFGRTALHWAASNGYEMVVRLLVDHGADLNAKCNRGWTVLTFAAASGQEEVVGLLLETGSVGVDAKAFSTGGTALSEAAANGNLAVVKQLLKSGQVEVDYPDVFGKTPLWRAASFRHKAVVKELADHWNANINVDAGFNGTPLRHAAFCGHDEIVKQLLESGKAQVNIKDECNRTALSWAAEGGHEVAVRHLLEIGHADMDARDDEGMTALHTAAANERENVVKLLVEAGAPINAQDNRGRTPLQMAMIYASRSIALTLIARGADLSLLDCYGRTCVEWASVYKLNLNIMGGGIPDEERRLCLSQTIAQVAAKIAMSQELGDGEDNLFNILGKALLFADRIGDAQIRMSRSCHQTSACVIKTKYARAVMMKYLEYGMYAGAVSPPVHVVVVSVNLKSGGYSGTSARATNIFESHGTYGMDSNQVVQQPMARQSRSGF
jgi:ankyrin repeat protein